MAIHDFSRSLPMMLYRALDAVMPRFRRIFNEFGLTEQQWRVLRVLWVVNGVSLRELADLTLIPAPSLVGVVDRLQKSGLITRRRSDADRRVVFVVATPAGLDLQQTLATAAELDAGGRHVNVDLLGALEQAHTDTGGDRALVDHHGRLLCWLGAQTAA